MSRILLIEEDPVQSYVLATYLRTYCTAEVITTTGEDCIKYLPSLVPIDVVVMDWYIVPGHNGIPVIQCIHNIQPQAKIIVYTSSLEKSDETAALNAGADKFIRKSGSMLELQEYLNECFSDHQNRDIAGSARKR
jgi:CheY-like chemotaxis protein